MAQRTGVDGFLAPKARLASARVILALAVVATLPFLGCGGGDSGQEKTAAASTAPEKAPSGSSSSTGTSSSGSQGAGSSQDQGGGKGQAASQQPQAGGGPQQQAKVQLPKGEREPQATPAEEAQATVADIALTSPALHQVGAVPLLPSHYGCDGANTWPALQWQGVPSGTKELVLFAMNVQPVDGKLFFDWAVAKLDPSLNGIESGRLPKGATVGRNSFGDVGYGICPPQGSSETYVFALHAVPHALSPLQGFDPDAARRDILAQAANGGLLTALYER
jgi:phosphatidylethanolamine-binding protein (PEBP) family uncharacterized protein